MCHLHQSMKMVHIQGPSWGIGMKLFHIVINSIGKYRKKFKIIHINILIVSSWLLWIHYQSYLIKKIIMLHLLFWLFIKIKVLKTAPKKSDPSFKVLEWKHVKCSPKFTCNYIWWNCSTEGILHWTQIWLLIFPDIFTIIFTLCWNVAITCLLHPYTYNIDNESRCFQIIYI